ncbi:hypothetical protein MMC24_000444 [Lignoscripta atroalba]|nr:hypothetical protein [Lignoscripta atroalba]
MDAIMPQSGSMPSIGSVAANFARTPSAEAREVFNRFSNTCPYAEAILHNHGIAAYEDYMEDVQASKEAEKRRLAEKLARKQARAALVERHCQHIKAVVARLRERLASRHQ